MGGDVAELQKEMKALYDQQYNFSDRAATDVPQWMKDIEDNKKQNKTKADVTKEEIKNAMDLTSNKDPDGFQPWGIFNRIKPDYNGYYTTEDLPPETYEPPSTPKGKLRAQVNRLTVDF